MKWHIESKYNNLVAFIDVLTTNGKGGGDREEQMANYSFMQSIWLISV